MVRFYRASRLSSVANRFAPKLLRMSFAVSCGVGGTAWAADSASIQLDATSVVGEQDVGYRADKAAVAGSNLQR